MKAPHPAIVPLLLGATLVAGCARTGEIDATGGITAVRSACPVVGQPAGTGDVTLFNPPASTDAAAVDLTAAMTNVRGTCQETGDQIVSTITFDVLASRTRTDGARDVQLPFYVAVVRGGTAVVAKRVATVNVHFDAGQARATASGTGSTTVARSAATLPAEIRERLTRKRKAGDDDAAVDPLAQPEVRTAVLSASFEALVGFQLTDAQLRYNVTR
ncbi:hypothetical protein [Sphingomonas sp. 1P08PE]|uniref:hypothetical protein n=1 Tax=Sphingomonas sp. 1P08PE TaxID=554122 RepID=UPI00399F63DF